MAQTKKEALWKRVVASHCRVLAIGPKVGWGWAFWFKIEIFQRPLCMWGNFFLNRSDIWSMKGSNVFLKVIAVQSLKYFDLTLKFLVFKYVVWSLESMLRISRFCSSRIVAIDWKTRITKPAYEYRLELCLNYQDLWSPWSWTSSWTLP